MIKLVIETYRDAFRGLPAEVWRLSAVTLIHRSGTMVMPFLALYVTVELGMDVRHAGYYLAVYGLGAVLGALIGGRLSDWLGPRAAMIGTLVAAGVGFWILGAIRTPILLALVLFVTSAAAEAFRPPSGAAIGAASGGQATRAFALRRMAINLGMSIAPAVGGFLAGIDYRWLFAIDGATCFLAAGAVMMWIAPPVAVPTGDATDDDAPPVIDRSPWRDRPFLLLLVLVAASHVAFFQLLAVYPLTMHNVAGFSEAAIGLLFAVNTGVILLLEMVLVRMLRRCAPLAVAALGSVALAVSFVLVPFGQIFVTAAAVMVILTFGEMLTAPMLEGWTAERAPATRIGAYMGLFTFSFSIAFVIAPLAGTWAYQRYGPQAVWWSAATISIAVAAGLLQLNRSYNRPRGHGPRGASRDDPSPPTARPRGQAPPPPPMPNQNTSPARNS